MKNLTENELHCQYMSKAIEEAGKSAASGDVPVGAVIVRENEIISESANMRETDRDATAHAELLAIRRACQLLGGWHLTGCTLYVTLEPCAMCAGAVINSRISRVVIGAPNPKAGAMGSVTDLTLLPFNHKPEIIRGVMERECAELLRSFFKEQRRRGPRWSNGAVRKL